MPPVSIRRRLQCGINQYASGRQSTITTEEASSSRRRLERRAAAPFFVPFRGGGGAEGRRWFPSHFFPDRGAKAPPFPSGTLMSVRAARLSICAFRALLQTLGSVGRGGCASLMFGVVDSSSIRSIHLAHPSYILYPLHHTTYNLHAGPTGAALHLGGPGGAWGSPRHPARGVARLHLSPSSRACRRVLTVSHLIPPCAAATA